MAKLSPLMVWQALRAPNDARHETAGIVACVLHSAIFCVQFVVTYVVVKSREDVIDTYAGAYSCELLLPWFVSYCVELTRSLAIACAAYEYIPDSGFADVTAYGNAPTRLASSSYQANIPTADI